MATGLKPFVVLARRLEKSEAKRDTVHYISWCFCIGT